MTVNDVLSKLRVMLAADHAVVTRAKFADATLVDGTEVYTDGEMVVGAILYVKVEEGEAPFAPEGMHETADGMLITVGANGEIIEVATKGEEAPEAEVEMEEVVEVPVDAAPEAVVATEELLTGIAELITPFTEEIAALTEEVTALKARFNKVAGAPAAKPIRNTFSEIAKTKNELVANRMEALRAIRKK